MWRIVRATLIVLAVAAAATPLPRSVVERVYARGVYPMLQTRLTAITNRSSVAWLDVGAGLLVLGLVAMWVARLRRAARGSRLRTAAALSADSAAAGAVVYLWFWLAWGLNYQRAPLREQLDFDEARISRQAVTFLAIQNVEALNRLHREAHREGWPEFADVPARLRPAFARAQRDLGVEWQPVAALPKRSVLDWYFTRTAIDGMTDPFFLETLTNQGLLPFERTFTVAHEWSHLAGYADESEANFVGWLVCMRGPASAQYSAWISLYGTILGAVPRSEREGIARELQGGPRADLRAIQERIRAQTVPLARRASEAAYDRFLKANRVEAGIRSYSDVIRLLVGTRFTPDGTPVLR
jgi:hypothetical protein